MIKQLVIISGKGGTGKTSIVSAFSYLANNKVIADCDVDASDLHLILKPDFISREEFSGGKKAMIIEKRCEKCGLCKHHCKFDAIKIDKNAQFYVDPISCEGCGVCYLVCPSNAVVFEEVINGEIYESKTKYGFMSHANLFPGEENSGKLVAQVRNKAKQMAGKRSQDYVFIDGSPGIGCPVIASVAGVDFALIITEPTMSGFHDLERVIELTSKHFSIKTGVCINKWDINPEITEKIKQKMSDKNIPVLGYISYDNVFTKSQIKGKSVMEYDQDSKTASEIKELWKNITQYLN